jgi:hypothetical protein
MAYVVGCAIPLVSWRPSGTLKERLADIEVPRSMVIPTMPFAVVGRRRSARAWNDLERISGDLGTLIGSRMRQSEKRSEELLALQASTERFAEAADKRDEGSPSCRSGSWRSRRTCRVWRRDLTVGTSGCSS